MKRKKKPFRSPFMPLIFMVVIMIGYVFGAKKQPSNQLPSQEEGRIKETIEQENEPEETKINSEMTDASLALEDGVHIQEEPQINYAKEVIEKYIDRKVVACSSAELERIEDENIYEQSFDTMTGYMGLAKISATEEARLCAKVTTQIKEVTVAIVFPDHSYVILEQNESVECRVPKGNSTILYIGENLSGQIKIELQKNDQISSSRL